MEITMIAIRATIMKRTMVIKITMIAKRAMIMKRGMAIKVMTARRVVSYAYARLSLKVWLVWCPPTLLKMDPGAERNAATSCYWSRLA
jgi:hypothetical protein